MSDGMRDSEDHGVMGNGPKRKKEQVCLCYEYKGDRRNCPIHPYLYENEFSVKGAAFRREPGGAVRVRIDRATATIPAAEWNSIVAHLADGGSAEAFAAAESLNKRNTADEREERSNG